ncbi:hypothetical protein LXL04_033997 [Taraxacum kok-saghyz]
MATLYRLRAAVSPIRFTAYSPLQGKRKKREKGSDWTTPSALIHIYLQPQFNKYKSRLLQDSITRIELQSMSNLIKEYHRFDTKLIQEIEYKEDELKYLNFTVKFDFRLSQVDNHHQADPPNMMMFEIGNRDEDAPSFQLGLMNLWDQFCKSCMIWTVSRWAKGDAIRDVQLLGKLLVIIGLLMCLQEGTLPHNDRLRYQPLDVYLAPLHRC